VSSLRAQQASPSLEVNEAVRDFGKVLQGEVLKHVFVFTNRGLAPLKIMGIEATCGCQTTALSAKQIPPGKSAHLEVAVDTAGLSGSIDKSVHILTNDPRQPSVSLSIKADVQPEITLSSPSLYFERVPEGEKKVSKEVILTICAERSIRILSAESTEESVSVRLEDVADSHGKKVRLIATQKPGGKIGYHMERIIVKTTSHLTPEISIYLLIRNFNR